MRFRFTLMSLFLWVTISATVLWIVSGIEAFGRFPFLQYGVLLSLCLVTFAALKYRLSGQGRPEIFLATSAWLFAGALVTHLTCGLINLSGWPSFLIPWVSVCLPGAFAIYASRQHRVLLPLIACGAFYGAVLAWYLTTPTHPTRSHWHDSFDMTIFICTAFIAFAVFAGTVTSSQNDKKDMTSDADNASHAAIRFPASDLPNFFAWYFGAFIAAGLLWHLSAILGFPDFLEIPMAAFYFPLAGFVDPHDGMVNDRATFFYAIAFWGAVALMALRWTPKRTRPIHIAFAIIALCSSASIAYAIFCAVLRQGQGTVTP